MAQDPFKIFISYRRDETSGHAGRLFDALADHFGAEQVFMDVDGLEPGVDFVRTLTTVLESVEVLLAVIVRSGQKPTPRDGVGSTTPTTSSVSRSAPPWSAKFGSYPCW